jgi:2-keto-3-deoxy-galactonokinase
MLLGDKPACDRYAIALDQRGVANRQVDGEASVLAGLTAIARLRGLL